MPNRIIFVGVMGNIEEDKVPLWHELESDDEREDRYMMSDFLRAFINGNIVCLNQRQMFCMGAYVYDNRSFADIARELKVSPQCVKNNIMAGVKRIREYMSSGVVLASGI